MVVVSRWEGSGDGDGRVTLSDGGHVAPTLPHGSSRIVRSANKCLHVGHSRCELTIALLNRLCDNRVASPMCLISGPHNFDAQLYPVPFVYIDIGMSSGDYSRFMYYAVPRDRVCGYGVFEARRDASILSCSPPPPPHVSVCETYAAALRAVDANGILAGTLLVDDAYSDAYYSTALTLAAKALANNGTMVVRLHNYHDRLTRTSVVLMRRFFRTSFLVRPDATRNDDARFFVGAEFVRDTETSLREIARCACFLADAATLRRSPGVREDIAASKWYATFTAHCAACVVSCRFDSGGGGGDEDNELRLLHAFPLHRMSDVDMTVMRQRTQQRLQRALPDKDGLLLLRWMTSDDLYKRFKVRTPPGTLVLCTDCHAVDVYAVGRRVAEGLPYTHDVQGLRCRRMYLDILHNDFRLPVAHYGSNDVRLPAPPPPSHVPLEHAMRHIRALPPQTLQIETGKK